MNTINTGEAIRFGWNTFKQRPGFFIGVTIVTAIISGIVSSVLDSAHATGVALLLTNIVSFLISTFVGLGFTAIFLKAHDSVQSPTFMDLWHPQSYLQYLLAAVLVGAVVTIGFILLIVPGIILSLMLMFASYIIIDKNMGAIDAMKESRRITNGKKWNLFVFVLAIVGINILGALCLLVGLLVSVPVSLLAIVHVYRSLEHTASEMSPVTPVATV